MEYLYIRINIIVYSLYIYIKPEFKYYINPNRYVNTVNDVFYTNTKEKTY